MNRADPKMSEGARVERAAFRSYLRRQQRVMKIDALEAAIEWVLKRSERYDKRKGGLGK